MNPSCSRLGLPYVQPDVERRIFFDTPQMHPRFGGKTAQPVRQDGWLFFAARFEGSHHPLTHCMLPFLFLVGDVRPSRK